MGSKLYTLCNLLYLDFIEIFTVTVLLYENMVVAGVVLEELTKDGVVTKERQTKLSSRYAKTPHAISSTVLSTRSSEDYMKTLMSV